MRAVVRRLPPLVLASAMLAVTSGRVTGTGADGAGVARFFSVQPVSGPEWPGSLFRAPSDTARKYHVRLTYTWSGEDPCMKGEQILEGEVQEEPVEDDGGFGGVLTLKANYVACGETAIGNRACLETVRITGQASFGGSILTEDNSGIDWEGKPLAAGEMVFHWKSIDKGTKVSVSGNCPKRDDSEYLGADYHMNLHFRPPPAGRHERFVLWTAAKWHGAGVVLDVWAGRREVVAIPRVKSPVVRAQPVTLDGTASKGGNLRYDWTFAATGCPPGATGHRDAKKTGSAPTVTLLCSMNVTLSVTDGELTDSETIPVAVVPRGRDSWTTPFTHGPELVSYEDADARPLVRRGAISKFDRLTVTAGRNICAKHYPAKVDHTLDPLPENGSWDGIGYDLAQVNDAGGPFHGYWYVAAHMLDVQRRTLMSGYLVPDGRPPYQGGKPFYEMNKESGTKVDAFLAAMRAHEGMQDARGTLGHSGLIRKQLSKTDPARAIEPLFHAERKEALRKTVDDVILGAEKALCDASKDPLREIWSGELLFPYAGSGQYTRLTAKVGGVGYGQSVCD